MSLTSDSCEGQRAISGNAFGHSAISQQASHNLSEVTYVLATGFVCFRDRKPPTGIRLTTSHWSHNRKDG